MIAMIKPNSPRDEITRVRRDLATVTTSIAGRSGSIRAWKVNDLRDLKDRSGVVVTMLTDTFVSPLPDGTLTGLKMHRLTAGRPVVHLNVTSAG